MLTSLLEPFWSSLLIVFGKYPVALHDKNNKRLILANIFLLSADYIHFIIIYFSILSVLVKSSENTNISMRKAHDHHYRIMVTLD